MNYLWGLYINCVKKSPLATRYPTELSLSLSLILMATVLDTTVQTPRQPQPHVQPPNIKLERREASRRHRAAKQENRPTLAKRPG